MQSLVFLRQLRGKKIHDEEKILYFQRKIQFFEENLVFQRKMFFHHENVSKTKINLVTNAGSQATSGGK